MFKRVAVSLSLACALAAGAAAQKSLKSWTQWSKGDVQKMLSDSPWAQTQTETDTSEMFFTPTNVGQGRNNNPRTAAATGAVSATGAGDQTGNNRANEGALNQATSVSFHIRWLSAKPIRQAIAREVALRGDGKLTPALQAFVDSPSDKRAVIAVTFESTDQRFGGKVMQAFNSAITSTLKNTTYLERKDGQRIFLADYVPPQQNALGAAMFVFPRTHREGPLLEPGGGDVRFVSEFSKTLKLDMKFKVSEMIYDGRLEY
jgi:hypothetical protein